MWPNAEVKKVLKDSPSGALKVTLSSQERLDLNISTTFTELAITTMNMLGKEKEQVLSKARGSYAPYRIQNCTGSAICIWSDTDGSGNANDPAAVKIAHDQTVDWRFDDWKTMREVFSEFAQSNLTNLSYRAACCLLRATQHCDSIRRQAMGRVTWRSRRSRRRIRFFSASSFGKVL